MKATRRSKTADGATAVRAAHLLYDRPVVFNDPYALELTSPSWRLICKSRSLLWLVSRTLLGRAARPIAGQILSRARYAEEKLEQAVSRGISQYVIVGAGLDSFCLRRPDFSRALRVFEMDHPATQQAKRERLTEISNGPPRGVEFVAVDFEQQTIAGALSESSFSKDGKAFFSWLGTTSYLTEGAVLVTLRTLASFVARGSEIVLDYLIPERLLDPGGRRVVRKLMRFAARRGETLQTFFDPHEFSAELSSFGYVVRENLSPAEQNRRYFANRSDRLSTLPNSCYMHAEIVGDPAVVPTRVGA